MPASDLPPEEEPKVKPFDPLVPDRTVIAVPLLKEIQEDLEFTVKLDVPQEFNAVIQFNENFSGGARAAYEKIVKLVERAKNEALEASTKRVESANIEGQPEARKRHDGLLESIPKMKISPPQPTGYSFAFLHAAPSRRE